MGCYRSLSYTFQLLAYGDYLLRKFTLRVSYLLKFEFGLLVWFVQTGAFLFLQPGGVMLDVEAEEEKEFLTIELDL